VREILSFPYDGEFVSDSETVGVTAAIETTGVDVPSLSMMFAEADDATMAAPDALVVMALESVTKNASEDSLTVSSAICAVKLRLDGAGALGVVYETEISADNTRN